MNLPNKLTVARIIATPLFMAALVLEFPFHYLAALVIFSAASITDLFDGKIARSRGLVTDFGKFLDPLADKMLTTSAFLGFMVKGIGWQTVWVTFIILFREFAVSSLRLVAVSSGNKVIAANMWGKCKTVTQMAGIVVALASYAVLEDFAVGGAELTCVFETVISLLLWLSAAMCIASGFIYFYESRSLINSNK